MTMAWTSVVGERGKWVTRISEIEVKALTLLSGCGGRDEAEDEGESQPRARLGRWATS